MTSVVRGQSAVYAPPSKLQQSLVDAQISSGDTSTSAPIAPASAVETSPAALPASDGTTPRPTAAQLQASFDRIVNREVSDGNLTDGEGAALGKIFGSQVLGVPGAASDGRLPVPQAADPQTNPTGAATSGTAAGTDVLAGFLKDLPSAQAQWSAYGATGATDINRKMGALLIDFKT